LVSGVVAEIAVTSAAAVDLLFVVDNSNSMQEEQTALRAAFPELLRALTSGDVDGDGTAEQRPVSDLHLGVVSTDLGIGQIDGIPGCEGLGDDGRLLAAGPAEAGCMASYPRFLEHRSTEHELTQTAADLACIAALGTEGCSFEQPLESALKALWPSDDPRVEFVPGPAGDGLHGQGNPGGQNAGFIRDDPAQGVSVIAIVVVTDEDDCSSRIGAHFTPPVQLPPNDPLLAQGLNTRCLRNPGNLFKLDDRYLQGFRALRVGNEQLVVFSAIVGVPAELVTPERWEAVTDESSRSQLYSELLAHPSMQATIDDRSTPDPGDDNLRPSCDRPGAGTAFPPRRIVELAEMFGSNGSVYSICQDDFTPAVRMIAKSMIGPQLAAPCLPRPLVRGSDGLVACTLVWELPPPNAALDSTPTPTPTRCDAAGFGFLSEPAPGERDRSDRGGARCLVRQLGVSDDEVDEPRAPGWYYDDFSQSVTSDCDARTPQRIVLTAPATPPPGVVVKLECASARCDDDPETCQAMCSAGPASVEHARVGNPCETEAIPEGGFDGREAYVETQNPECGDGVCIVYHLDGDPSGDCVPGSRCDPSDPECAPVTCASESEIQARVYCSCRCDAPEGFDACACPSGFACVPVLEQGADAVRGGYCVRDGTLASF
jgi:hypothetical protein